MFIIARTHFNDNFDAHIARFNGAIRTLSVGSAVTMDEAIDRATVLIQSNKHDRLAIHQCAKHMPCEHPTEVVATVMIDSQCEISTCYHNPITTRKAA
jgi:hypothetical protein